MFGRLVCNHHILCAAILSLFLSQSWPLLYFAAEADQLLAMANDAANGDPSRDDNRALSSCGLSKEAMDSLTCSICLELLYKPVVTACGHMFCFWCGHYGMNAYATSSCPLCRRSLVYFPRVCKQLHFLLMKAVPDDYARRGDTARRHEEEQRMFSPELAPEDSLIPLDLKHGDASSTADVSTLVVTDNNRVTLSSPERNWNSQSGQEGEDTSRQISLTKADLCCALCHGLLYHPVVLNCGDVFCKPCLKMHNFRVHCPGCGAPHPAGSVLVCLELDHFVQSAFPAEYASRHQQHSAENTPFPECECTDSRTDGSLHFCVGCDGCGMYPIIGDRYRCDDCEEESGYDLCGNCHNTPGSLMGRFNQKHQPSHRMTKVPHTRGIQQFLHRIAEFSGDEA
ncbi:hypothetical protein L7F22_006040 [Adiantum nelumboides]|nr:hypothetical protein [Adiantum nelumboides]